MKKVLSALLALLLALSLLTPMTALAESSIDLESNGWYYRYYYERGVARLKYYGGNAENLVVPDHIGAVPVEGFLDNISGTAIKVINNGVKTITFELQAAAIPKTACA